MSSENATVSYAIDPAMSRFTVKAFAAGLLSGFGHNPTLAIRSYTGTAKFAPDNLDDASLQVSIHPESLTVADEVSQKDREDIEGRMKRDVLQPSRFPEITFDSTKISANKLGDGRFSVTITGDLLLHGVRRSPSFSAQVVVSGATLRGFGEFTIRQTDYEIELVAVAGGALKVKDELKVSFDILARKQG
jgi:polyisoprenoid-binding protein YceI